MALDPRYKAVCFDMDGTFMRTDVDYFKLSRVIFEEMISIGVPEGVISQKKGPKSELDSGINWLRDNGKAYLINSLQQHISDRSTEVEMENADISRPYDGAVEAVELLRKKGYKTGILTRGGHHYAEYILKRSNVWDKFDAVVARDDFPEDEAKPSPKAMINIGNKLGVVPKEILYFGDHSYDWFSARDSGAGFYGVLTGGYKEEDWKALGENIPMIEGVASLKELIEN